MDQAAPAICFADSDDDDYVSFDEEELNTGIANLYDEDSASDYNDDDCEEEPDLDELDWIKHEAPQPAAAAPAPPPQQQQQQQAQPQPKAQKQSSFGGLMSSFASAFSSAPSNNNESNNNRNKRQKKGKASQLSKRMNRLRENQAVLESKSVSAAKHQRKKRVVHRQKVNTNVISVDLGTLKDAAMSTGDSFSCKSCHAMLSKHDELLKKYEEIKLDDDDESIWICSFCNHINVIQIDEEEVPKTETVDYILAPPTVADDAENKSNNDSSESQIIFCIDISGSMCVSQKIDSNYSAFKLKGNHLQKDHEDLSQFIDHNAGHLNQQTTDVQYVSRLQCVQTAVNEQIESMAKSHPNYKIGLVTFNNEVTVIGDGMSQHEIITGDKLKNMQQLKEIGSKCSVDHTIDKARDTLCKALWGLNESGQTALGPALVVSIAMAAAKPGSQVILCTDGLANIGVGSLDVAPPQNDADQIEADEDEEEPQEDPVLKWYEALGDYAMIAGVVVNIISITDDGCKLENLGKIVEVTNGNLRRINPLNLADKFTGIIENESIATNCQAKMILHPGLKFHNTVEAAKVDLDDIAEEAQDKKEKEEAEDGGDVAMKDQNENDDNMDKINEGRTIYAVASSIQQPGNVFEGSRIFFEYVINKAKRAEFKYLKQLPFQVQITYCKKDGSKMLRVISQTKEITLDKQKVRDNLNFNVLAKYGTHITTELCAKGDYESSRAWTSANTTFLNKNARNSDQLLQLANYAQENVALDHQMQRQIHLEENEDESDDDSYEVRYRGRGSKKAAASVPSKHKKKKKKKKMAKRKNARNDQFSSHMYNLKKKSHK